MNDVVKELKGTTAVKSDGFAGFTRQTEGEEDRGGISNIVKYNEPKWLHNGIELPPDPEYIVKGVGRFELKWHPDKSLAPERYVVPDGQPWPDLKTRNAETPREEWVESFGEKKGPWVKEYQVAMLNRALDELTYVTSTTGGEVAVEELVKKVNSLREFYGNPNICAVVKLSNTFMSTGYGGLQRPYFLYQRAVTFGDGNEVKTIEPPSAKDVTGDEIKF
jgi:hypothetical protein